jgi:putative Holliday junction resolvase
MTCVLAVDPGEARIGVAISDASGTVARPLTVMRHTSRPTDARAILDLAREHQAEAIVVGLALDTEGDVGPQARRALRLVDALRELSPITVTTWDESGSTQAAMRGRTRDAMLDARAAAVVLQDYLDAQAHS